MKVAGGIKENDIAIGNVYDKYGSKNPIVRRLMKGFTDSLSELVAKSDPKSIHEVGCGEGYWVNRWRGMGMNVRGSDFSSQVIGMARKNAGTSEAARLFQVKSVYDLKHPEDGADLIVCCEVMEHLEDPEAAMRVLQTIARKDIILSVPREPIWRALNLARGKYVRQMGNTEGHLQHWSRRSFVNFVSQYFEVVDVRSPLPWTMVLGKSR